MLLLDAQGAITDLNDAARALAVTEPSLLGRPLAELADFRPLRAVLSGEPEQHVLLGLPSRRYYPLVMPLVVLGREAGLMVILRPAR
jgi:hypothetical protein